LFYENFFRAHSLCVEMAFDDLDFDEEDTTAKRRKKRGGKKAAVVKEKKPRAVKPKVEVIIARFFVVAVDCLPISVLYIFLLLNVNKLLSYFDIIRMSYCFQKQTQQTNTNNQMLQNTKNQHSYDV
jgi:hypothetical protein